MGLSEPKKRTDNHHSSFFFLPLPPSRVHSRTAPHLASPRRSSDGRISRRREGKKGRVTRSVAGGEMRGRSQLIEFPEVGLPDESVLISVAKVEVESPFQGCHLLAALGAAR